MKIPGSRAYALVRGRRAGGAICCFLGPEGVGKEEGMFYRSRLYSLLLRGIYRRFQATSNFPHVPGLVLLSYVLGQAERDPGISSYAP